MISLLSVLSLLATGALAQAQAPLYGQCGGTGWNGATECSPGSVCTFSNPFYSQCLPGVASSTQSHLSSTSRAVTSVPQPTTSRSAAVSSTAASTSSSVPVPTGAAPANAEWAAALVKARTAVAKLTLKEKVSLGTGVGWMNGACLGNTPAIPSINFPGLCLQDSPVGIRFADKVSAFPAAINVASTFNREFMRARGVAMGNEFRGKGVNVALTPMMNLARTPAGGRNWEGFVSADPYLSGEAAYESIIGLQSAGVQGSAKHYVLNEQEHFRTTSSSNADDRTLHELYLKPFLRSVQANVASIMCSYNQLNGTYACENDKALNGLLKGEFGFQGYVMSDWQATHSTLSVNQGLDMTMPGDKTFSSGTTWFGDALVSAVNSGRVSQARIDDLATRILAAWYLLKQDSGYPAVNFDSWTPSKGSHVDVQSNHKDIIREIGAASTVLLKNTNSALPLKAPKSIGIVGNGAGANPGGPNACVDRGCNVGVLGMGWGSGTAEYPYLITPLDAITSRAKLDGTTVSSSTSDSDLNAAGSVAAGKDVTFVFITADSGEGYLTVEGNEGDRNDLKAWHNGDALVQKVASVSKNTIVVCNTVGAIVMESWINNPNVTAVVWSGLPGQEAGNSLVDVLYGAYNPSGRLPYTIGRSEKDYSARVIYNSNQAILPIPYTEGLFIDYFGFDKAKIAPRFEFGFGLSYTTFTYSGLTVSGSTAGGSPSSGPGSSLDPWLHDKVITVSVTVKNTGTVAGTEIPQLYTSPPASANTAPYLLRGFDSVPLAVGESKVVTFGLSRYDLSVWDVVGQKWTIPAGTTGVSVGASSRDLRLTSAVPA